MVCKPDDESSEYLYMYDLDTGEYKGKLKMNPIPKWLQGIAYYDGNLYVTSDDGDADDDAPDHMYRVDVSGDKKTGKVNLEKTFDDVRKQGDIEGLTFDENRGQLLILYNRCSKIVAGSAMMGAGSGRLGSDNGDKPKDGFGGHMNGDDAQAPTDGQKPSDAQK